MPEFGCLIITAVAIVTPWFRRLNFNRDYENKTNISGGGCEGRTRDKRIKSPLLYQLS